MAKKDQQDKERMGKLKKRLASKKTNTSRKGFEKPTTKKRKGDPLPTFSEEIRLNKYIANAGICSRREADVLIKTGVVEVNGKIVTEMGVKVKPGDEVKYDGAIIQHDTKRYILLNKPKNFKTAMVDKQGAKTAYDLVRSACKEIVYPADKLDLNTTGLLLFTNDGDMMKRLTHPKFKVEQLYHATLSQSVKKEDIEKLIKGVELEEGGFIKAETAEIIADTQNKEVGLEIRSVKNNPVHRLFEAIGYNVIKLDRVTYAGLTKKDLPRGKYRHLDEKEVSFLKMV